MSYQVLARKWRPRKFSELVGQEHVVRALTNALDSGRMHHAYLFTGTRGVGKTTVSRILAKSLNCLGANGQGGITGSRPSRVVSVRYVRRWTKAVLSICWRLMQPATLAWTTSVR